MQLNPSEISELIKSKIENLAISADLRTQGTVVSVTDGICRVYGLTDVMQGEMLEFPGNTFGLALNLDRDSVGAAFFRYPDSTSNLVAVYPHGYRPDTLGTSQDLSASGGVTVPWGAWTSELSLTFGGNRYASGLRHSLNASLGPTSPTSFHLGDFRFDQLSLNLDASRPLSLSGFAQAVNLAVGAE